MITIDASILVAAVDTADPSRDVCQRLLKAVLASGERVHQPTLAIVEVVAAIGRRTGDPSTAMDVGATMLAMPGLVLHDLDLDGAADAAAIAVGARVRGADAVYAAVAMRHDATLVTLDDELLERVGDRVVAMAPDAWLQHHG